MILFGKITIDLTHPLQALRSWIFLLLVSAAAKNKMSHTFANSHFSTTMPTVFNSYLSTIASQQETTSLQWPLLYSGHFSTVATSLQWPALYHSHLSTTATLICFSQRMVSTCMFTLVVTSLQWPPLHTGNSH